MMVVFSAYNANYAVFEVKNEQRKIKSESSEFIIFKFNDNVK